MSCPIEKRYPDDCPRCGFGESVRENTPLIHLKIIWLCKYPYIGNMNYKVAKDAMQSKSRRME